MAVGVFGGDIYDGNPPFEFYFKSWVRKIELLDFKAHNIDVSSGRGYSINIQAEEPQYRVDGKQIHPSTIVSKKVDLELYRYTNTNVLYCKETATAYIDTGKQKTPVHTLE